MDALHITPGRRRVLERLKRGGPATAGELAARLEVTDVAVRQHLTALETDGLVGQRPTEPRGRGRPSVEWSLTSSAQELFPDRHADLTVELIADARAAFGDDGLDRLVQRRARRQVAFYRKILPDEGASPADRVRALARQRTAEGYMAEVVEDAGGALHLIEHHCPICEAAESCTGLCDAELDVFRAVLGDDVRVERTRHLLAGGDRCVYRIERRR